MILRSIFAASIALLMGAAMVHAQSVALGKWEWIGTRESPNKTYLSVGSPDTTGLVRVDVGDVYEFAAGSAEPARAYPFLVNHGELLTAKGRNFAFFFEPYDWMELIARSDGTLLLKRLPAKAMLPLLGHTPSAAEILAAAGSVDPATIQQYEMKPAGPGFPDLSKF